MKDIRKILSKIGVDQYKLIGNTVEIDVNCDLSKEKDIHLLEKMKCSFFLFKWVLRI